MNRRRIARTAIGLVLFSMLATTLVSCKTRKNCGCMGDINGLYKSGKKRGY